VVSATYAFGGGGGLGGGAAVHSGSAMKQVSYCVSARQGGAAVDSGTYMVEVVGAGG
jgi:hypothetical protein